MLTEAGSVASRAGLVVSLGGLGFAIWHILRLRGETKAARKAEEKARLAMSRETARMTLTRVNERIEGLKELHRNGEWYRALDRYPELCRMLIDLGSDTLTYLISSVRPFRGWSPG
jgi:negative regulator of replication initiation